MKLNQDEFELLIETLKGIKGIVYDRDARLFLGGEGTQFPAFQDNHGSYIMYTTISGKTFPLEHGISISMTDKSRAMEPPKDCRLPCAYALGVGYHFDKPLEVLALETKAEEGVRPKWDIYMLRDISDKEGYLNNKVAKSLSKI
jgi:hypothetical protein